MAHYIRIGLSNYGEEEVTFFDPDFLISKVIDTFPEAVLEEIDPRVTDAIKAESILGKDNIVVKSKWRNVEAYGPTYAFSIIHPDGKMIRGYINRIQVDFSCAEFIPSILREKIIGFLEYLNLGSEIEEQKD